MLKNESEFKDSYFYTDDEGNSREGEIKYTLSVKNCMKDKEFMSL